MRFAITCPGCGASFRSSKERPVGKGVECPKCGARFYVSAENQEELRDDPPRRDDDRPARRRPRDEEDDAPPARRDRHRERDQNRDDVDDHEPVRRRPKGGNKVLLLLGTTGLLLFLACGGAGAYFLFFRGGGSAEDKVRPPRDLPMDMFAYVAESDTNIRFVDVKYGREVGDDEAQLAIDGVFPNAMRWSAELRYVCATGTTSKKVPGKYLLAYESPVDLAAVVAELKLQPLPGKLSRVYVGQFQTNEYAIFQPAPNKLFVACSLVSNKATKPNDQVLEELLARDPSASALPADLRPGIDAVSGYPVIKVLKGYKESAVAGLCTRFTGSVTTASIKEGHILTEAFTIRQFESEADAKTYMNRSEPKADPNAKYHYEKLDDYRWLHGNQFRTFSRTKTKLRPDGD